MTEPEHTGLWAFALEFYGRPGVAEACLALQDRHGLNVNLLLWCCYLAKRGQALTPGKTAVAANRVAPWNKCVTVPLRAVRRAAGKAAEPGATAVYERLKETELASEQVELALLQEIADGLPTAAVPDGPGQMRGLALGNLGAYLTCAGKVAYENPFLAVLADRLVTAAENR